MRILLRSIGGGFGRVLGRILCYIFLGYVGYIFIKTLGIDLSDYIPFMRSLIV